MKVKLASLSSHALQKKGEQTKNKVKRRMELDACVMGERVGEGGNAKRLGL